MIVVERATEDDLAELLAIDHSGEAGERDRHLTDAVRNRQALIARVGEERVGFAVVNQSFFGQHFVELLMVHADFRRRGVASALMHYVEKTRPNQKLFTSTNESNLPMQALLDKLGYSRSGYVENLDEGDPELIYFKRAAG